jgi:hypothetical protein
LADAGAKDQFLGQGYEKEESAGCGKWNTNRDDDGFLVDASWIRCKGCHQGPKGAGNRPGEKFDLIL